MSQVMSTIIFVSLSFVKSHKTVGRLHPRRTATDLLTDLPFCLSSFNAANWQRWLEIYCRTDYLIYDYNKLNKSENIWKLCENYDSKSKQTTNWCTLYSGYSVTKLIFFVNPNDISQRFFPPTMVFASIKEAQ